MKEKKKDEKEKSAASTEVDKNDETDGETKPKSKADSAEGGDELEQLRRRNEDLNDKMLRILAEYDNYRKRMQRERDAIYPEAVASTLAHLLPVLDNIERAASCECSDAEFKKGFDMILALFKEKLAVLGVEEIGKEGERFNPEYHEAVMHVDDEELGENVICGVMQKGYKTRDRLIRHAMVRVAN